ncbi:MAG: rod shape-determining protein [Acidobacteria bacterium]|nr:rod shape-determining protein [Acidobacteriota bacterium]
MSLMSSFASDVAIDLGTANTCVFARGRGIVVNEPSIVAFNTAKGQVEAVGQEAYEMLGRTPPNITAVRPMKDGVIADFDAAEKMLMYFVRKAYGRRPFLRPRLLIGVPPEITPVERRAVKDSGYRVKASEVHLVDEPMAAAIGSGLPVAEPAGNMIVDIGGGTTDIAVISMAGTVYGRSLRVAGDAMNEAITTYMKRACNLLIGERTAEQIKWELGSAMPLDQVLKMDVKGRHVSEGVPRTVTICDQQIREALSEPLRQIVQAVRDSLERIPPELSADIYDRGVVLTGGGAMLRNLDRRLAFETGLPVLVAENPLTSVVVGAGMILSDLRLLRKVSWS